MTTREKQLTTLLLKEKLERISGKKVVLREGFKTPKTTVNYNGVNVTWKMVSDESEVHKPLVDAVSRLCKQFEGTILEMEIAVEGYV